MKNYREIADSVFARRDQYVIAQRKKKQVVARATVSVGSVALVSLAGFALWRNDAFHNAPPVTDGGVTTTAAAPTGAETTTATTAPTTDGDSTDTTTVTDAPTQTAATAPSTTRSQTTATTTVAPTSAPTKTEPTKTTAPTTAPAKLLIAADTNDNTGNFDEEVLSVKKRYLSRRLKETMAYYEGEDYYKGGDIVVYAVVVSMPSMKEYSHDFWNSNEEWAQIFKEMDEVYDAFDKEAHRLNPSWDGVDSRDIEIWTDTMRANYERYLTLIKVRNSIHDEYYAPYVEMILEQQFEALNAVSSTAPVDICENSFRFYNAYYVELTADAINTLAERGGYTFSLAMANQRDYSGTWFDE